MKLALILLTSIKIWYLNNYEKDSEKIECVRKLIGQVKIGA